MKVYVSCPISVPQSTLDKIMARIVGISYVKQATHWKRGSFNYDPTMLATADVVIIVHPNNSFDFRLEELPVGVRKEFDEAIKLNKKVLLAYHGVISDSYNFYTMDIGRDKAKGLAGTGNTLALLAATQKPMPLSETLQKIEEGFWTWDTGINPCREIKLPTPIGDAPTIYTIYSPTIDKRLLLAVKL
jgi:hypothetical protein